MKIRGIELPTPLTYTSYFTIFIIAEYHIFINGKCRKVASNTNNKL